MQYRAKKVYQNENVVSKYDVEGFSSLKGRLVNNRELFLIGRALDCAEVIPPATIIDIPCGTGRLSINLANKGFNIRGVDLSPKMVSYTSEKIKDLKLEDKIKVEVGNAESLGYPDNIFDAGVSLRLLGHTPPESRIEILKELRRVLRKVVVLVYYHRNSLQSFLKKQKRRERGIEWYPVTYKDINNELIAVGLKVVRFFPLLSGVSETIVVLAKK